MSIQGIPQIAYWKGVRLSEVPREELEQALVEAHQEIERLSRRECELSVANIKQLGLLARR